MDSFGEPSPGRQSNCTSITDNDRGASGPGSTFETEGRDHEHLYIIGVVVVVLFVLGYFGLR